MVLSQVVQGTGEFHDVVREIKVGLVCLPPQAQNIFDNTEAFDPGDGVFVGHPRTGQNAVQDFLRRALGASAWLFWGWKVNTPGGA